MVSGSVKSDRRKSVTILGVTGSVGRTTFGLVRDNPHRFVVEALAAGQNWQLLAEQARQVQPKLVAIADPAAYRPLKQALAGTPVEVAAGAAAVIAAAQRPAEMVVAGIVGLAGLPATIAAVRRGAVVAFANKECLISAGQIMKREVERANATLLPVDSEHNAIFQVFEETERAMIESIILTASGGPFRRDSLDVMAGKTREEALAHPNWDMGAKISIDSATMMNKGLEIIEAHYLFDIPESCIEVLVHPQSIVHSMVRYRDGSVLAQLGTPEMTIPISYALAWPGRMPVSGHRLDLTQIGALTFEPPDEARFPALRLAREVLRAGGASPLVLNAANEVAVGGFLERRIGFNEIVAIVEDIVATVSSPPPSSIDDVIVLDGEVRRIAGEHLRRRRSPVP